MGQYMIYWEIQKRPILQTLKSNTEAVPICRIYENPCLGRLVQNCKTFALILYYHHNLEQLKRFTRRI